MTNGPPVSRRWFKCQESAAHLRKSKAALKTVGYLAPWWEVARTWQSEASATNHQITVLVSHCLGASAPKNKDLRRTGEEVLSRGWGAWGHVALLSGSGVALSFTRVASTASPKSRSRPSHADSRYRRIKNDPGRPRRCHSASPSGRRTHSRRWLRRVGEV